MPTSSVLQVRMAQELEQPRIEAAARKLLEAADGTRCTFTSNVVTCMRACLCDRISCCSSLNNAVLVEVQPLCGRACSVGMSYAMFYKLIIRPLFKTRPNGVSLIASSFGSSLRAAYDHVVVQCAVSGALLPSCFLPLLPFMSFARQHQQ